MEQQLTHMANSLEIIYNASQNLSVVQNSFSSSKQDINYLEGATMAYTDNGEREDFHDVISV